MKNIFIYNSNYFFGRITSLKTLADETCVKFSQVVILMIYQYLF